jgi:hypothetical protein
MVEAFVVFVCFAGSECQKPLEAYYAHSAPARQAIADIDSFRKKNVIGDKSLAYLTPFFLLASKGKIGLHLSSSSELIIEPKDERFVVQWTW